MRSISRRTSSSERTAPCRYSSAKPRIEVSGVRSSWLASATKRRIRFSEPRACSSEACWARKAFSIRDSIPFSAVDSRPTSVRSSPTGTRWDRSPAAMARAVRSTSASGRRLLRTSRYPAAPSTARTISPTTSSMRDQSADGRLVAVAGRSRRSSVYPSGRSRRRHPPVRPARPRRTVASGAVPQSRRVVAVELGQVLCPSRAGRRGRSASSSSGGRQATYMGLGCG